MTEPTTHAKKVETIVPGILRWSVHDDRIDAQSDAHAVEEGGRTVLIDPLPLEEQALKALGEIEAICLTGAFHQRSAWRYRRRFGVKVYAPEGAEGLEEEPDVWYRKEEILPGGLRAVHAPGPVDAHYVLHLERGDGALFCSDILIRSGEKVTFLPDEYLDDPKAARETARRFLDLRFSTLCFDHGAPITEDPHAAIREALEG